MQVRRRGRGENRLAGTILLCLSLLTTTEPSFSIQSAITLGQTVEGELGPGDKRLHDGTYYDLYVFQGGSRQKITLELTSPDFDPYLSLLDRDGMEIVSDHGSGGRRYARITQSLSYSGKYYVRVNSLHKNQQGKYTLRTATVESDR